MNQKNNNISKTSIIIGLSIGLLIIIGIAIIISIGLGIIKTDSQAQLQRLESRTLALNELNNNSKALGLNLKLTNKVLLASTLDKAGTDLELAKLEVKNNLLSKQLDNNRTQLLVTRLDGHKELLATNLSRDLNLLERFPQKLSVKSELLVDSLAQKLV